jgi:hypothetical protein
MREYRVLGNIIEGTVRFSIQVHQIIEIANVFLLPLPGHLLQRRHVVELVSHIWLLSDGDIDLISLPTTVEDKQAACSIIHKYFQPSLTKQVPSPVDAVNLSHLDNLGLLARIIKLRGLKIDSQVGDH